MKINIFLCVFSIAISALLAYIIYSIGYGEENTLLTALSFIADTIILITGIGIQFDNGHSNTNIKVLSVTSVIAAFIAELILGFASGTKPAIVIVIGVVLLVYLLVLYLFPKSKI